MSEAQVFVPFQVSFPGEPAPVDALGLWLAKPAGMPDVQASGRVKEVGCIWRADLPDDREETARLLETQAWLLKQTELSLPAARERLQADLRRLDAQEHGAAFAVDPNAATYSADNPPPVLALAAQYAWPEQSFGILGSFKLGRAQLEQAGQAVSGFTSQVHRAIEQLAVVETSSGGRIIGVTRVSWAGEVNTAWQSGARMEQYTTHQRVLAQALATRQAWLRFLMILSSGALRVAASLATGPFSMISIWTTWNYLQQVVSEFQKIKQTSQP